MCYTFYVLEYLSLLGQVERPEVPLPQKRGMMDILSRIVAYMNNEQIKKYKQLCEKFSEELKPRNI